MNNAMTPFQFEAATVRVINRDNEPWFVAKDVCDVLEMSNSRMALQALDVDEKDVSKVDTLGGTQRVSIISESGLYALIMRSNKPQAKAFRKWVTSEVLPTIRKHGAYMTPDTLDNALEDPSLVTGLLQSLHEERIKRFEAEKELRMSAHKVTHYDEYCLDDEGRKRLSTFGAELALSFDGVGPKSIFSHCRKQSLLSKTNSGYRTRCLDWLHIDEAQSGVVYITEEGEKAVRERLCRNRLIRPKDSRIVNA